MFRVYPRYTPHRVAKQKQPARAGGIFYHKTHWQKKHIDVAVNSYMERPSIRVASKTSWIPEKRIRAILNEVLPPVKEEKDLFEEDSIYKSIKEEIEIKQRELKNLRKRLSKREKRIISLKDK